MFDFNGKTPKEIIFNGKSLSKLLFNGIEVWRKSLLPDGYLRCEYLESTGTQYIDIGLKVSNKTKVELVGKQYGPSSSLFGVNPLFVITSSQSTDKKQLCRFRYNNTTQDTNVNILELSKITFDKNKGYINDVLLATFTEATFSSTYNAILFGRRINSSGALEELAQQRIDYFKMWENDVLVRDMIPCLDNNGTPCMYDTVSGKTFYNQGTGEFIAGPISIVLPEGYTLCDYLESTGTQYIDTGYIPTINTDIKTRASVQYNAGSTPVALFGYLSGNDPYNRYAVQYHKDIVYVAKGKTEGIISTINYTKMCNIETQGDKYIYNGIEISVAPLDFSVSNNLSIILFARQTTNVNRHSKSKIEFFKIYEKGVLVQYLIPCLDNNGVPCMYDMVSKQTFYNQGTGEFKWSINPTYLSLNMFVDGFVNSSTGAVAPNSTYPRAISSPLVLFEKGKTYKLTTDLSATKTDDGVRFRIYGTDDTYKMSLGASQITTNAYATFEALDDLGKANFYVAKDILITPKQDFKARIMYIDSNYISEFKIEGLD